MNKKLIDNEKFGLEIEPSKSSCLFVLFDENRLDEDEKDYDKWLFTGEEGGQIVFSTDVNSKKLADNAIKNKLLQLFSTVKNRLTVDKTLDKVRQDNKINYWTIGKYLIGTYTVKAKNHNQKDKVFNENSLSIDCIGITQELLFKVAEEVRDIFKQESVLVRYKNKIYFVD